MRMRKKPNLVPRMERCAATLITDPEALRGHWLEQFPGHQALRQGPLHGGHRGTKSGHLPRRD